VPAAVRLDDGRLEQDHELFLDEPPVGIAQQAAPTFIRHAWNAATVVTHIDAHQAADGDDISIGDAHDRVGFADLAAGGRNRGRSAAPGSEVYRSGNLGDLANRWMHVQRDVAVLVDLRRHIENDALEIGR